MRILVASENAAERQRAGAALRARPGVEVLEASSAADTHRILDDHDLDCVVIDGDMRPEGGYSVLYEARAQAQMAGTPLPPSIALMGRHDDRWLANWAGATEAILKPVDSFVLAERVLALAARTGTPATAGVTAGRHLAMDEPPELDRPDAPPVDAHRDAGTEAEQPPARG